MDTENESLEKDVSFNDGKGYEHAGVLSSFLGVYWFLAALNHRSHLWHFMTGQGVGRYGNDMEG